MGNLPFINCYGIASEMEDNSVQQRERCYIVIKKEDLLLCLYDEIYGLYAFPDSDLISVNAEPILEYMLHCNVMDQGQCFKELQTYKVYEVEDVVLTEHEFKWCPINDILVAVIPFDARQKYGFKNLVVRVER